MTSKDLDDAALIGLGARHGDRLANLTTALGAIRARGLAVVRVSSIYETEPVGLPGDQPLLNAAAAVRSPGSPRELLDLLLEVEHGLGRRRGSSRTGVPDPGWRPIDLDLLLFGSHVIASDGLTLPHPRMHLRRFVLMPLSEIAPGVVHPVLGRTVADLDAACTDTAAVRLVAPSSAVWPPRDPRC